jgi:hypothetical protein
LLAFHSLSPWRSSTSVATAFPMVASLSPMAG